MPRQHTKLQELLAFLSYGFFTRAPVVPPRDSRRECISHMVYRSIMMYL